MGNRSAARRNKVNPVTRSKFHFEKITEEFVSKELLNLSVNMSSGLDNMHPRLLKEAAPFISKHLKVHLVKNACWLWLICICVYIAYFFTV